MSTSSTPVVRSNTPSSTAIVVPLWKDGAPGTQGKPNNETSNENGLVTNTYQPTLYAYLPPADKANGMGVIVCPGGGYHVLEMHREGVRLAQYLNSIGIAGIVLKYRLRDGQDDKSFHDRALADAQRAIRTVRANAAEWNLNPHHIGIGGFSAGGHLSANAGLHYDAGNAAATDPIERVSSRPDFLILIYGSFGALTDEISSKTPPAFLAHASDDTIVPADESTRFYDRLYHNGVSAELHIFPNGGHGFDMGKPGQSTSQWVPLLKTWLLEGGPDRATTRPGS